MEKLFKPPQKLFLVELEHRVLELQHREEILEIELETTVSRIKFLQNIIEGKEKALCQQTR